MPVRGPEIDRESIGHVTHDDLAAYPQLHLRSDRVGRHFGGRPARTFTCLIGSVKIGGRFDATIDYVEREGDFATRDDLEHVAGDADRLREAARAIDATARSRNGKTAERVLIKVVHELPAEMGAAQRRQVAEREVDYWRSRGHEAIAAVHGNGAVQPHVHVLASARPVTLTVDGWTVDRSVRVGVGRKSLREERKAVADLVNSVLDQHAIGAARFYHGRDAAMEEPGITDRPPRKRVPEREYRGGQREASAAAIAEQRRRHEEERHEAAQRAEERAKGKAAQQEAAVKIATAGQRRLILAMAKEAGVEVSDAQLSTLDGGDLVAAVKAAKRKDRDGWQAKITAAEGRAAAASATPPGFDVARARAMLERDLKPHIPPAAWDAISADPRALAGAAAAMAVAQKRQFGAKAPQQQPVAQSRQPMQAQEPPRRSTRDGVER